MHRFLVPPRPGQVLRGQARPCSAAAVLHASQRRYTGHEEEDGNCYAAPGLTKSFRPYQHSRHAQTQWWVTDCD